VWKEEEKERKRKEKKIAKDVRARLRRLSNSYLDVDRPVPGKRKPEGRRCLTQSKALCEHLQDRIDWNKPKASSNQKNQRGA